MESTEDGYELRDQGLKLVQGIIGGAAIEDPALEPTPVDMSCSMCGGDVAVCYERGWVYNLSTECDGLFDEAVAGGGVLSKFPLDPAGLTDRSAAELYAAGWVRGFQRLFCMMEGVCPSCSGPVERSMEICDDHREEGLCPTCGYHPGIVARFRCSVCKEWSVSTIGGVAKYHPAAVGFHYEHDLPLQYGFNELEHINERLERTETDWEVVGHDPQVVRVTMRIDGDELWLDLAEDLTVLAVGG